MYNSRLKSSVAKFFIRSLAICSLLVLTSCSGTGSCPPSDSGVLSLKLTAPDQYPAGLASPITAYLTISNTSNVNANNLYYTVPLATNHTGVDVTVANDSSNPCRSIPAHQSCTFSAIIGAYANPGSFTVVATPNNLSTNSINKVKSLLGVGNDSLSLTANIGLTNIPTVTEPGNNDILFLYNKTIASNADGSTLVSIVAYVNGSEGNYNTINLTDVNGTPLNFSVLSGNSGSGSTNLTTGSLVTFLLTIPAGSSGEFDFYAQTMNDGAIINQGTYANPINITNSTSGVLSVQPSEFKLSTSDSYTAQTVTYTNIGNGEVTNLTITPPALPLSLTSNNCGSSLAVGSSCTVVITSNATPGASGSGSVVSTYTSGGATQTTTSHYNYVGANAESGISLVAVNGFNFISNTVSSIESTQVVLSNIGNVAESNFSFTFNPNNYFSISAGANDTSCSVTNNVVTNILTSGQSCSVTLTYNGPNVVTSGSGNMIVNYYYNGIAATPVNNAITYDTAQATANLLVNPASYSFGTIVANDIESETKSFVVTNNGPDTISSVLTAQITGNHANFFTILPSGMNDCSGKANINVGESCNLVVRFGTTLTVESNVSANIALSGTSTTGGVINSATNITGVVRAPLSANIQIYKITHSMSVVGGNGESQSTAFQIESTNSTGGSSITLYYRNTGVFAAKDFTVDTSNLPSGYTVDSDSTCGTTILESNSANDCYVVLQPNSSTPGALNITLSSLPASWIDERGQLTNQTISWNTGSGTQNTVYVNIFASASVNAVLSSSSTGTPVINDIGTESTFYVVFTLSGGYNVGNKTYTVTTAAGFSPYSSSCVLSGNNPTCSVEFTAPSTSSTDNTITVSGNPTPSPSSFTVDITDPMPAGCSNGKKCIFVTQNASNANLGGFSGADAKCLNDPANPLGVGNGSWKALLWGNNSTTVGTSYYQANGSTVTFIATATDGNLVGINSVSNALGVGGNKYTWVGAVGGNCSNWTSTSSEENTSVGNTGIANAFWSNSGETNTSCAYTLTYLYCVQQ